VDQVLDLGLEDLLGGDLRPENVVVAKHLFCLCVHQSVVREFAPQCVFFLSQLFLAERLHSNGNVDFTFHLNLQSQP